MLKSSTFKLNISTYPNKYERFFTLSGEPLD